MQRQERPSGLRLRDGHTLSIRVRLFMADGSSDPGSGYKAYRTALGDGERGGRSGGNRAEELQARREEEARQREEARREEDARRSEVFNWAQQASGSVRSLCRVRPRIEREASLDLADFKVAGNRLFLPDKRGVMTDYDFNHVFGYEAEDISVLEQAWDSVQKALGGTDTSIILYGQTGSGKSYLTDKLVSFLADKLFGDDKQPLFGLKGTWVEVYNDKVKDLLCQEGSPLTLSRNGDKFQHGATEMQLLSKPGFLTANKIASSRRTTSSTRVNVNSSRSHSVMTLFISALGGAGRETRLQVVDLAGSEELQSDGVGLGEKDQAVMKQQRKEGTAIKLSLTNLGVIIRAAEEAKRNHSRAPPRFQDTLTKITGPTIVKPEAETLIIFTLSPLQKHEEKSRSTLRAADEILREFLKAGEGARHRA